MKTNRAALVVGVVLGAVAMAAAVLVPSSPAGAAAPGRVEGHVTDPWGDPVEQAYVQRDWEPFTGSPRESTYTDASGYYDFDNVPIEVLADDGAWSMEFSKWPVMSSVAQEIIPPLVGTMTVDATLLYLSEARPASVRTDAGDAALELLIDSTAPRPGVAGGAPRTSCAWIQLPGSAPAPASFVGSSSEGRSLFSLTTVVAAGTAAGSYPFDHWLADCADPALLLSERASASYEVRDEALQVVRFGPTVTTGPSTTVSVTANRTIVSSTFVVDGVVRTDRSSTGSTHAVSLSGLSDGMHTASVTISDGVETVGPVTFSWRVDALGPVLSDPTPQGVTGDATPTISVIARDLSSVDRVRTVFVLTDPQGRVRYQRPTFSGDTLTWQVEVPLTVAGPYVVTAQVWDSWGNYRDLTWSFEYRRLANFR